MSRIELTDTALSAAVKMAEGNPGAATVIGKLLQEGPAIDPDSALAGLGSVLGLDTHEIYGSDIWVFYKDICGQNIETVLGCLRSVQLGHNSEYWLKSLISGVQRGSYPTEEDFKSVTDAVDRVKKELPNFGVKESEAA